MEVTIGVICGSVPNLPALFRRHAPGLSRITDSLLGLLFHCGSRSKKSYELPRHVISGFNSRPKTPWRRQVETDLLVTTQGFVLPSFVTSQSVPLIKKSAKRELERQETSEGPRVLNCLRESTRRAQSSLQMDARQDVIITISASTRTSFLLTRHLNHLRKISKAQGRLLAVKILPIAQRYREKRGIGIS